MYTSPTIRPYDYRPPVARVGMGAWGLGVAGIGLGADGAQIGTKITGTAASIAGANAGSIAGTLGLAVPVVGVAIAGITMAITAWLNRMGPKQKRWTTQIADDATAQLQSIKSTYFSTPYNPANQQAAISATQQMLQAIQDGCGQSQMGDPGKRCISERLVRGGSAPWCPTKTGCDYLTVYLDPIVNDPRAGGWAKAQAADPLSLTSIGADLVGGAAAVSQNSLIPLALGGAALLFLVKGLKG